MPAHRRQEKLWELSDNKVKYTIHPGGSSLQLSTHHVQTTAFGSAVTRGSCCVRSAVSLSPRQVAQRVSLEASTSG
jgi:hypothetical protein